jgi:hypothetical protein
MCRPQPTVPLGRGPTSSADGEQDGLHKPILQYLSTVSICSIYLQYPSTYLPISAVPHWTLSASCSDEKRAVAVAIAIGGPLESRDAGPNSHAVDSSWLEESSTR